MTVRHVEVTFDNVTSMSTLDSAGREIEERVLPSYEIRIPVPGRPNPLVIMAFQASDTSVNPDTGEYNDWLVRHMRDEGFSEFHVINDAGGHPVTVMMRPMDWTAYQTGLSSFAVEAARHPNLYEPNAASTPFGLFGPQAQAGSGTAAAPTPFRPLSVDRMRRMGLEQSSVSMYFGEPRQPVEMMAYVAPNDAARSALRNAGYVEVPMRQPQGEPPNQTTVTVTRFMSPLDARAYQQASGPVVLMGIPW